MHCGGAHVFLEGSHEKILMMKTMLSSMMIIMLEFMMNRCFYQNAELARRHDEYHSSNHDEDTSSKLAYNHGSIHDE
jgi:hypothetical protein